MGNTNEWPYTLHSTPFAVTFIHSIKLCPVLFVHDSNFILPSQHRRLPHCWLDCYLPPLHHGLATGTLHSTAGNSISRRVLGGLQSSTWPRSIPYSHISGVVWILDPQHSALSCEVPLTTFQNTVKFTTFDRLHRFEKNMVHKWIVQYNIILTVMAVLEVFAAYIRGGGGGVDGYGNLFRYWCKMASFMLF